MGKAETRVSDMIRLELSKRGCKVFRSQVGLFYTQYGDMINVGIKGESDLRGHRPDGKAFYLECKTPIGKARPEQKKFILAMRNSGALAGFAHSVDEALAIVFPEKYKY